MKAAPELKQNPAGGYDLIVERDSGNPVLILTGRPQSALKFFKELKATCEDAIELMEDEE